MSETKIDRLTELVKLYKIIDKRIEKRRESEEKEGKLQPETSRDVRLALKLLDMIEDVKPKKPEKISVSFSEPKTESEQDKSVTETS